MQFTVFHFFHSTSQAHIQCTVSTPALSATCDQLGGKRTVTAKIIIKKLELVLTSSVFQIGILLKYRSLSSFPSLFRTNYTRISRITPRDVCPPISTNDPSYAKALLPESTVGARRSPLLSKHAIGGKLEEPRHAIALLCSDLA